MPDRVDRRLPGSVVVHQTRALTVELGLLVARFARDNNLHPTDVRALIALLDAERSGLTAGPGWLAGQLGLDSSSVTALVDRMVDAGHVERAPDPRDRRRVSLRVTAAAVSLGQRFFGPLIDAIDTGMDAFTAAEAATISRFLAAMTALARGAAALPVNTGGPAGHAPARGTSRRSRPGGPR